MRQSDIDTILNSDGFAIICIPLARDALRTALRQLDVTVESELYDEKDNSYVFICIKQDADKLPIAKANAEKALQQRREIPFRRLPSPTPIATVDAVMMEAFAMHAGRQELLYSVEPQTNDTYTIYVENEVSQPGRMSATDRARVALACAAVQFAGVGGRMAYDDIYAKHRAEDAVLSRLNEGVSTPFFVQGGNRVLALSKEGCEVYAGNEKLQTISANDPAYAHTVMNLVQDMPKYDVVTAEATIARTAIGEHDPTPDTLHKLRVESDLRRIVEAKLSMDNGRQSVYASNIYDGNITFAEFFKTECLNDHFESAALAEAQANAKANPDIVEAWVNDVSDRLAPHIGTQEREAEAREE